jgi:hypothetical protein
MTKLNGHDQFVIQAALELWQAQFEKEIRDAESNGKRVLYDIKFPGMVAKDLNSKIASLTKKK